MKKERGRKAGAEFAFMRVRAKMALVKINKQLESVAISQWRWTESYGVLAKADSHGGSEERK